MVSAHDGHVVPSPLAVTRPAKTSDTHWALGLLMVIIAVAGITGIVIAVSMGLTNLALAIGIVGCAFFARAWC
ncbi:hypothetical protein [Mycolicibacterium komossense]|uniref:Uncharacterized protein n=1 Tax=Mycolicibacterium komossense TaxID=1779 RepID=A0ABT3CDI3_9MYCO|nr:hypothetical protein [Mycolicibacterium komossense]MCV7227544.1 hypothetical protein [Mycolicibacterium komossense]